MFIRRIRTWPCLLISLLSISSLAAAEESQQADESWSEPVHGLAGRIELDRHSIVNGTLILHARMKLKNQTDKPLKVSWANKRMSASLVDAQGKALPKTVVSNYLGPYSGFLRMLQDVEIPANDSVSLELHAGGMGIGPNRAGALDMSPFGCWEFHDANADCYLKVLLEIPEPTAEEKDLQHLWFGGLEFPLALVPLKKQSKLDEADLVKKIEELGKQMIEKPHTTSSEEAERQLSLIHDPRVIPWYVKAIKTDSSMLKQRGLDRLAAFKEDLALEGIKHGMQTQAEDIGNCSTIDLAHQSAEGVRHTAAHALVKSPHPKAKELLLSMRFDPYYAVRLTVLQTLGKKDNPGAEKLIEEMRKDLHPVVRSEAERYLKLLREEGDQK